MPLIGDGGRKPETIADPVATAKATLIRSAGGSWRHGRHRYGGALRDELQVLGLGRSPVTPSVPRRNDAGTDIEGRSAVPWCSHQRQARRAGAMIDAFIG